MMASEIPLRSLVAHLKKEHLVDLLVEIGGKIPEAAEEIRAVASTHIAHRKLFVHNLNYDTTSETLREAFSSYGEILEGSVIANRFTGKSRGYGFVTFKTMESAQKALENPCMSIDGHVAFFALASERSYAEGNADAELRRLYVSSFSPDITTEMLISFFRKYGEIEEGAVVFDSETKSSRGFGFVTFKMASDAKKAIADRNKILGGERITAKYANAHFKGKKIIPSQESVTYASPMLQNYPTVLSPWPSRNLHFSGNEPYGIP